MAEDEQDTKPSLEPPRLFGRRRTAAQEDTGDTEDTRILEETSAEADPPADAVFTDVGADAPAAGPTPPTDQATPSAHEPGASVDRPTRRPLRLPHLSRIPRIPRPTSVPAVPRYAAAAVAGLVTGLGLLALVWLGFRTCESATGVAACGTGPGLVALVVVFLLGVLLGRLLLGLLKVPEAGMTSFLAVGLTSLVVVLSPEGLLDSAAILVVLPLLTAGTFAASSWVATLQLDPGL